MTPRVEAATPWLWLLPSLGVGVGLPVRVTARGPTSLASRFGVRFELSVCGPVFGFVTSLDLFPGIDRDDDEFLRLTILAQISI